MNASALVIGIGNLQRGDDGVGLEVAQAVAREAPAHVVIRESTGDGAALLSEWEGYAVVVLVDATQPTGQPGRIQRFDAGARPLPADLYSGSTHTFGIVQGIELARAMGLLPPVLIVYGIEGDDFTPGALMTTDVYATIPQVTAAILADLKHYTGD